MTIVALKVARRVAVRKVAASYRRVGQFAMLTSAMHSRFFSREVNPEIEARIPQFVQRPVSMQRAGKREEVAAAVAFLASEDTSFITGVEFPMDGGYLAR